MSISIIPESYVIHYTRISKDLQYVDIGEKFNFDLTKIKNYIKYI